MPISYFIDAKQECAFITLSADITEWDVGVILQELWSDPLYQPHFMRLVDAASLRSASLQPSFLKAVARDFTQKKGGKVAFVTASDSINSIFLMYAEQLGRAKCGVFGSKREALDWLSVEDRRA